MTLVLAASRAVVSDQIDIHDEDLWSIGLLDAIVLSANLEGDDGLRWNLGSGRSILMRKVAQYVPLSEATIS